MRYFFIEQPIKVGTACTITGPDVKHIRNVLRLKPGDTVFLFDGKGFEHEAEIVRLSAKSVHLSVLSRFSSASESPLQITVAQGFLKEKKMESLIRPLSELGVSRWVPFFCERSVPRPDPGRLSARTNRWRKIARESLKQCRRARPMEIAPPASLDGILQSGQLYGLKVFFWEEASRPLNAAISNLPGSETGSVLTVLGPEGGLSKAEAEAAEDHGFISVTLGPRILRAETATLAAIAVIQFALGDLGQKYLDKNPGL